MSESSTTVRSREPTDDTRRRWPWRGLYGLRQWWLDRSVRRKALLAMGVPLMVVLLIPVAAVLLGYRASQIRTSIRETSEVTNETNRLMVNLGLAQTAVLRFAATGEERYLEPYDQLAPEPVAEVEQLEVAATDVLETTDVDVATSVAATLEALARLRDDAADPVAMPQAISAATEATDGTFAELVALRNRLEARLVDLRQDHDRIASLSSTVLIGGVAVALLLGLAGAVLTTRDIVHRIEALKENVDRFESGKRMAPIAHARDEIGHLINTLEAVGTLLRKSSSDLTASRDEAVTATRAKDEFLSRMSHELRTPLTAIIGFGQLLQMEDLSPDDRESVDHIVNAGDHLLALINDVLDIARIETGHVSLSVEPVVVTELAAEAVALVRPQAAAQDIIIETSCDDTVAAFADRQRLRQVLINLLSNAIKYNHPGGHVELACRAHNDTVHIIVRDTGMGISPNGLTRLFTPFDRLDAAQSGIEGTGVGLALSKGLVEAMKGTMGVDSTVGEGSTFWLELARADEVVKPDRPARAPLPAAARLPATGPPVLYVEDNLANLRLVERIFRDRPERLKVAMEGHRAIEMARELQPRLILLDLNLPDLNGDEVLRILKAAPATADIPVVVISADATPWRTEQVKSAGADAYLHKPIDVPRLLGLLDEFLLRDEASRAEASDQLGGAPVREGT